VVRLDPNWTDLDSVLLEPGEVRVPVVGLYEL